MLLLAKHVRSIRFDDPGWTPQIPADRATMPEPMELLSAAALSSRDSRYIVRDRGPHHILHAFRAINRLLAGGNAVAAAGNAGYRFTRGRLQDHSTDRRGATKLERHS
jgi:hypothetical protein